MPQDVSPYQEFGLDVPADRLLKPVDPPQLWRPLKPVKSSPKGSTPPGGLSRSASEPNALFGPTRLPAGRSRGADPVWRTSALSILFDFRAAEGGKGLHGVRLAGAIRHKEVRETLARAVKDGNIQVLRAAIQSVSHATGGDLPRSQEWRRAKEMLSQAEKCALQSRRGLAQGNMWLVQEAIELADTLDLGPGLWEDPSLREGRARMFAWHKCAPYWDRLERARAGSLTAHCACWVTALESECMTPEHLERATAELAARPGAADALAALFDGGQEDVRLLYDVAWEERGRLVEGVRFGLSRLGRAKPPSLCFRLGGDAAKLNLTPVPGPLTAVIVSGPEDLLAEVRELTSGTSLPVALGQPAQVESQEARDARIQGLIEALRAGRPDSAAAASAASADAAGDVGVATDVVDAGDAGDAGNTRQDT